MASILPYVAGAAVAATLAVVIAGVVSMMVGGRFNARWSNVLMRARVVLQGLAVALLLVLAVAWGNS